MVHTFTISLPAWVAGFLADVPGRFTEPADRMRLVIALAAENIRRQTGGPFAAAVFAMDSGKLIAVGVNCVVPAGSSIAHAEIVALSLAQQALNTHDLSADADGCELVTSCAPCAMCLGAIPWSGVRSVLCGAGEADARAVGFDEGDKPDNWQRQLRRRGIAVTENLLRDEARQLFSDYRLAGGPIYNPAANP
jgi:tRNA(Arg) A34 adenosine deaminase TadA